MYLQYVEVGFYDSQTYKEEQFFFIQKRARERAKCAQWFQFLIQRLDLSGLKFCWVRLK